MFWKKKKQKKIVLVCYVATIKDGLKYGSTSLEWADYECKSSNDLHKIIGKILEDIKVLNNLETISLISLTIMPTK